MSSMEVTVKLVGVFGHDALVGSAELASRSVVFECSRHSWWRVQADALLVVLDVTHDEGIKREG
jgi:hypothetical protein